MEFQKFGGISEDMLQQHFDEFFEDVYLEMEEKYGAVEEMNICENLGDHLVGMANNICKK